LAPMRPIAAAPSMCAMPATRVENTKGAMIILIRRRNRSVTSFSPSASEPIWGVLSHSCAASPAATPRIIARIRKSAKSRFIHPPTGKARVRDIAWSKNFVRGERMLRWLCFAAALAGGAVHAETFTLNAGPTTVAWGNYDATRAPVLHIKSGDTVTFRTLLTNSPTGLEKAGVAPDKVEQALRDVYAQVTDKGPGGHILNGPVYIEGAEPGDTLEIHIKKIDLAIPYAYNGFRYGAGILTDDFPYARTKIIPLDKATMTARFAPGITIPLHPFFGSMGVAPPPGFGRYDSTPPTVIGGNMDNKELAAGSTIYFPVFVPG